MKLENLITEDRDKLLREVLESHNKTEEELRKDVEIIKKWLNTQKHLPEIPGEFENIDLPELINPIFIYKTFHKDKSLTFSGDTVIANFLTMNKFSIEMSKQKLDMYYTIRNIFPEIFQNKHPKLLIMKEIAETV